MTYRHASNGKRVSLLGYGAMRLPTIEVKASEGSKKDAVERVIDQEQLNRQVRHMLDGGINYFDTAPVYCRGESERALGIALKAGGYARGDYVIATKLSNFAASRHSAEASQAMFEKSLAELQTDYIDNYLLHSIGNNGFETFSKRFLENGMLDWCCDQRRRGRIRNLGFSYHGDRKAFDWCMAHHDRYRWDFCMIQMNYIDWNHAVDESGRNLNASEMYATLTEKGIPVVVMEPLRGGRLARPDEALMNELKPLDPEATAARWALRFCGSFPNVMTVLSGMTYTEHIDENLATFSPLRTCSRKELAALERAALAWLGQGAVPCTSCNYCMPCPYGLDIPTLIGFRNDQRLAKPRLSAGAILKAYERAVPEPLRRAEHCTGCGRCRPHCPQRIDIAAVMAELDAWIDELKDEVRK